MEFEPGRNCPSMCRSHYSCGFNQQEIWTRSASQRSDVIQRERLSVKICFKKLLLVSVLTSGLGLIQSGRVSAQTFSTLYSFTGGSDEGYPSAVIISGNTLFGTTPGYGIEGNGTVFSVNIDSVGFTNVYSFTALTNANGTYSDGFNQTNSDGALPEAGLILSGNTLYGTASQGGSNDSGTVFRVNTDGSDFTCLHNFTWTATNSSGYGPS